MPRIFLHRFTVPDDAIDELGHVNNLRYLAWMQEVAIAHSAAQGWPMERYLRSGAVWVVRSHGIEYLRPAYAGDELALFTWVAGFSPRTSPRRYLFWRRRDRRVLAEAETMWAYVDVKSGRPRQIGEELRRAFEIVEDRDEVMALARAMVTPSA